MPKNRRSGHTLFELLIVLAIAAFAAAVAAPCANLIHVEKP